MKRIFTTTTLTLMLFSGALASAAGPEHGHDTKAATPDAQSTPAPTLEDIIGKVELPELFIGSSAPELQIAKFIKGESVSGFEKGQVYVVEFWATWCGPCVAAFPHLTELQSELGEKVRIIGVNVWEGVEDQGERIEKVEGFVADQGDRMGYTVAVEDGTAMADNWMKPAGQNGIPAAFIVDGTGHIAWIGHPATIEEPLKDVIDGKFDPTTAVAEAKKDRLLMAGYQRFAQSIQTDTNIEEALQIANILINDFFNDEPAGLNAIAWMILTAESPELGVAEYKVAHRAIALANEKSGWKDWSLLDTYALAAYKIGHKDEAVKWQKKSIELAPTDDPKVTKELQAALAKYQGED